MDVVLAHYVDPVKGDVACHQDWSQLWSKSRHDGNTVIDSFGVEDGQGLFTTSTSLYVDGTENEEEEDGLESDDKGITTNVDDESPLDSTHLSCTTFMPSHLISAMKGSRMKQGLKVGKLTVSWAADVYDPPVTSQSHSVSSHDNNVNHSARHKKNYRNKHNNKNKAKSQRNCRKAKGSSRGGSC